MVVVMTVMVVSDGGDGDSADYINQPSNTPLTIMPTISSVIKTLMNKVLTVIFPFINGWVVVTMESAMNSGGKPNCIFKKQEFPAI